MVLSGLCQEGRYRREEIFSEYFALIKRMELEFNDKPTILRVERMAPA